MLFPIQGVPISIEGVDTLYGPPSHQSEGATEHWAETLRSVWSRIPSDDRDIMVDHIENDGNTRLSFQLIAEWLRRWETNAFFLRKDGIIGIDAGYATIADSEHLGATMAHELAHYRDFAGDVHSELTEATARQIAEGEWGSRGAR